MKELSVITLLLTFMISISAQSTTDTVYIDQSQALQISAIINADTSVSEYRVYVLERGARYFIEHAFEINSSCKFIATGDENLAPPLLLAAIRADDSNEEWFFKFIQSDIDVELNDLYLLAMRPDGLTLGSGRAIWFGASNVSLKARGIVFDGFSDGGIKIDGNYYKLDVQDCHFRNLQHATSWFGGQPMLTGGYVKPDTTIFINNTFFACNSYIFSIRGLGPKAVFEHNTIVYGVVNPFIVDQAANLIMDNNLFYGAHAMGGTPAQVHGGWFWSYPDSVRSSIYQISKKGFFNGEEIYGPEEMNDTTAGLIFEPSTRVHQATFNNISNPEKLVQFYSDWNDTVTVYDSVNTIAGKRYLKRTLTMAGWTNDFVEDVLDSLTNPNNWDYAPGVNVANNMFLDPQFTDTEMLAHVDSLIDFIHGIATDKLDNTWPYKMTYPPAWPLPEDLSYTNSALIHGGSDGFAIGDLNWFPEQKEQWVTGVEVIDELPQGFELSQNYPNPFNPTTKIKFSIAAQGNYALKIYNVLGQEVAQLHSGELNIGTYETTFNASRLGSGVYFYTLIGDNVNITKKMMLIK
ncbi:MAG: T9SS type A sorting domain-containing protein [Ignavibacteria bacterium]|jgi:hypothetical protein